MSAWTDSFEYYLHREEERERREQALERHQRQQGMLFPIPEPIYCSECGADQHTVQMDAFIAGRPVEACCKGARPCEYCGEIGGSPVEVEDRDDSVGYHAMEQMCTLCAPRLNG